MKPEKKKKLVTKEDYLSKLLEAVSLLRLLQAQNTQQNQVIEEYIQSLIEQITPEKPESEPDEGKEREPDEAQQKKSSKKESSEMPEKEKSQKNQGGMPSPEEQEQEKESGKSEKTTSSDSEMKERTVFEEMVALIKAQEALEKVIKETKKTLPEGVHSGKKVKASGSRDSGSGLGADVDPYTGGEAQSRNRAVKKDKSGRLYAGRRK